MNFQIALPVAELWPERDDGQRQIESNLPIGLAWAVLALSHGRRRARPSAQRVARGLLACSLASWLMRHPAQTAQFGRPSRSQQPLMAYQTKRPPLLGLIAGLPSSTISVRSLTRRKFIKSIPAEPSGCTNFCRAAY